MTRLVRDLPLFTFVLAALVAVLAYGTVQRLTAHAVRPAQATVEAARALAEEQGQVTLHVADCDKDLGPGEAESVLAQHPAP
jgi:hypothetical protein